MKRDSAIAVKKSLYEILWVLNVTELADYENDTPPKGLFVCASVSAIISLKTMILSLNLKHTVNTSVVQSLLTTTFFYLFFLLLLFKV